MQEYNPCPNLTVDPHPHPAMVPITTPPPTTTTITVPLTWELLPFESEEILNPLRWDSFDQQNGTTMHEREIGVHVWMCYGDDIWRSTTASASSSSIHPGGSTTTSRANININPVGGAPSDNRYYGNIDFLDGTLVRPIESGICKRNTDESDDDDGDEDAAGRTDDTGTDQNDAAVRTDDSQIW